MKITLSPITFDPIGSISFQTRDDQTLGEKRRRMNRVATLDGGAVFNDFGYSEADRTIQLRWAVKSKVLEESVERLVQLYSRIHLATPQGFFLAAIDTYTPGATESSLSLLVVDKLS